MESLHKMLIESALKEPKTQRLFRYFRKKWRYLDPDVLESHFHYAIIKAVRIHQEQKRSFTTTLSMCINWEIKRGRTENRVDFYSSDFEELQKRKIGVADQTSSLYNRINEWMEKYLGAKEREVIRLRIMQNCTWKEISNIVKCDERSAKNNFFSGLSQLRYISKAEGIKLCDELDLG